LVTTVAAEAGTDVLTAEPPLIIARAIAVAIMVRMDRSFGEFINGSLALADACRVSYEAPSPRIRVYFAETVYAASHGAVLLLRAKKLFAETAPIGAI
jgi:hypothetical protein